MFTGIVQKVLDVSLDGSILKLKNDPNFFINLELGASIAVDGVCLTITNYDRDYIYFFVMEETLKKTTFIEKDKTQWLANIETALKYNSELGGHIIQGHVHGISRLLNIDKKKDGSTILVFNYDELYDIHYKDSIAINGTSLTISSIDKINKQFSVSIIPYTLSNTNFLELEVGSTVNIEYNTKYNRVNYMEKAYQLSLNGKYICLPNPIVGCVLVYNDIVIGQGYHSGPGKIHAEIEAINNAIEIGNLDLIKDSTMYVTLEPCCHFGRTPPCVNKIIEMGIKKVVVGIQDPDIRVSGNGINRLISSGIEVTLETDISIIDSIKKSLHSYIYNRETGNPYIIAKIAMSIDGYTHINNGSSKWLTSLESRTHAHKIRAQSQAIIVGSNTILKDNPILDSRLSGIIDRNPEIILMDRKGTVVSAKILEKPITILTDIDTVKKSTLDMWLSMGHNILYGDVKTLYNYLREKRHVQCIIEGGATIQSLFFANNLVNEIHIYRGNTIIGINGERSLKHLDSKILPYNPRYVLEETLQISNDIFSRYLVNTSDYFRDIVIPSFKAGKPVIIMDDTNREDEGDLVVAAEHITPELVTFIKNNTTGIICVTMDERNANRLGITRLDNNDINQTPFGLALDYKDCKTGVSSYERFLTISKMVDSSTNSSDFFRPGHMFPLISSLAGISQRRGHTESSVDLCKIAGCKPMAVIGELVDNSGNMMRERECRDFANIHNIPFITIGDIEKYYNNNYGFRILSSSPIYLNSYGQWTIICYNSGDEFYPHKVLVKGTIWDTSNTLVRVHSECFTGDVLGSMMCDCGEQLKKSMEIITESGRGIIIFPHKHEGRGIGLSNKIKAYKKMWDSRGKIDTFMANNLLGFDDDLRSYDIVKSILDDYGLYKIYLLTNNNTKIKALEKYIEKYIPISIDANCYNKHYLETKYKYNN